VVKKIKRPPGFTFNLNNAVDMLLKKELTVTEKRVPNMPFKLNLGLMPFLPIIQ
jgi:hypothetical protein